MAKKKKAKKQQQGHRVSGSVKVVALKLPGEGKKKGKKKKGKSQVAPSLGKMLEWVAKKGGFAAMGAVGGEMLRTKLLEPKKDGAESTLARWERENTGPMQAVVAAAPGLMIGGAAYWLARKNKNKLLRQAGESILLGSAMMGIARLLFAQESIAKKTTIQIADKAPAASSQAALPAPSTGPRGYPYGHYGALMEQAPYEEAAPYGDTIVPNPYADPATPISSYGDTYVAKPGPTYVDRVRGLSASDELARNGGG